MINNLYDGQILSDKITRDQFEEINEDLFQKTLNLIKSVLYKTNINKEEIDGIILSGGSTKIFKIQKIITDFFKDKRIYSNINPEEVVAYGIGLISGSLSGDINSRNIIKINPYSFYLKTDDDEIILMIHENININSSIIKTKRFNFSNKNQNQNQKYFHFEIYVINNDESNDLLYLDQLNMTDINPNENNNIIIEITFELTYDFNLKITAQNEKTIKSINIDIEQERSIYPFDYYKKMVSKKALEINTIYSNKINELKELKKKYMNQIRWFIVNTSWSDEHVANYYKELQRILIDHFDEILPELYNEYGKRWKDHERFHEEFKDL